MPRIAKVRTYFWKKKLSGEDPQTTPDPTFNTTFSVFLFCDPLPSFSAPSYATDIYKYLQIWMIPHIITLFEFISVPYENQHQTLNIKKIDRGQIRLREYLFMHTCQTAGLPRGGGGLPLSLLSRGRFRKLTICFIFSSYRSISQIAWLCWANVGIWSYGWPMVRVESTTLAQHCPNVNILSLAVGSITSWNQYVGPTLGQCTPMAYFNMTELRWVHYVGPTLDQRMPATLVFW